MPITAKLSKQFYDNLGEETANELVEWFNQVDTSYRTELRELNELNFQRFDAKLEQRFAEQEVRLSEIKAEVQKILARSDARWMERMITLDQKWDRRFNEMDVRWEKRFGELGVKLEQHISQVRVELIRWMFAFWVATVGVVFLSRVF